MIYWLCEYSMKEHLYANLSRRMILIVADTKENAEIKFEVWYEVRHPDMKLQGYKVYETIL